MKKNWTMKVGVALVALTLITSCFVGGTFAKYTKSGSGEDSARVAKFGVHITANGTTFADAYADEMVARADATATVVADTAGTKVVAPGTKGNMTSMTLTGAPEVDVEVKYAATVTLNEKWADKDGNFYFPITVKVNNTEVDLSQATDAAGVKAAIEDAINAYTKTYGANTDLSSKGADSLAVSWEWPFSTSAANDVKDTYLGDQAAAGNAAEISLKVETTVTQID